MGLQMRNSFPKFTVQQCCSLSLLVAVSLGVTLAAHQTAPSSTETQREAMRKLSFLAGRWTGPVTISRGQGEPFHLTQTEDVQYKLDGLILLVEGRSTSPDGNVVFTALATIAYEDASHTYHFRAYHDGHYVDSELTVPIKGFSWSFSAGPARIINTMHLTEKGEWNEVSEVTVGSNPAHRSVEMLLQHQL
jgi:hypothetical protein